MITAFDMLLICPAILIMLAGFAGRCTLWRAGRKERRSGDIAGVLGFLIGQQHILKRRYAGIAHLCLFWGIAVFLLVIILAQFPLALPGGDRGVRTHHGLSARRAREPGEPGGVAL